MHWLMLWWKKFEKKREFRFNNFVGISFCCIAFLASKFFICFKNFIVQKWAGRKYFIWIYFRYYLWILYWIFHFIFISSLKVFIGNYISKNLIKKFWYLIIIRNDFFGHYIFYIFFMHSFFFSNKVIFKRFLTLSVKKGLTTVQNVLLSAISVLLTLPNNFCFALIRLM